MVTQNDSGNEILHLRDSADKVRAIAHEAADGAMELSVADGFGRPFATARIPVDGNVVLSIFDLNLKTRVTVSQGSDGTPYVMVYDNESRPVFSGAALTPADLAAADAIRTKEKEDA